MLNDWSGYWCHSRAGAFIEYVGVWDTVGELGIPKNMIGASSIDANYQFHDATLSPTTKSARHAVSIDERRDTYAPTLWANVDDLNKADTATPYAQRPYQQCWFPGHHSGVGGGQDDKGLSNSALLWVAAGAQAAGLVFDGGQMRAIQPNPTARFVDDPASIEDVLINTFGGTSDRMPGPKVVEEVSEAALTRCGKRADYEPATLRGVRAKIDAANAKATV